MAQTGKKWYVLRAVSGKEGKVKEYLEALMKHDTFLADNVGEILLPTEKYAQLRNGKRVVKEKLFLPGYVLVEANLQGEIAHTLRFMPNVLGFLGGLDNPTEGTITVKGRDISTLSANELADYRAASVGFVFQSYNLIPTLTVIENVALVKEIAPKPLSGFSSEMAESTSRLNL